MLFHGSHVIPMFMCYSRFMCYSNVHVLFQGSHVIPRFTCYSKVHVLFKVHMLFQGSCVIPMFMYGKNLGFFNFWLQRSDVLDGHVDLANLEYPSNSYPNLNRILTTQTN